MDLEEGAGVAAEDLLGAQAGRLMDRGTGGSAQFRTFDVPRRALLGRYVADPAVTKYL